MNNLVRFFVERSLMTNLLVIGFLAFSFKALLNVQKEGFPAVSFNTVTIQTIYPGASAIDVETNVTILIEDAVAGVSGVQEVTSSSKENLSIVTVKVDEAATPEEFQMISDDLNQAIDGISGFPSDLEASPIVRQIRSTDMPIIEISVAGSYESLRSYIPILENKIKKISDVSQVNLLGFPDEEIQILVDPDKLKKYSIDLKSVAGAINQRNIEGTAGTIDSYDDEQQVVIFNKIKTDAEIKNTILRMSTDGKGVTLGQVASIKRVPKQTNLIIRNNGKRGVSVQVIKKSSSDIIKTIAQVQIEIEKTTKPADISITLLNDKSSFTRNRLKLLGSNAIMGFFLVAILLYFSFGLKVAVWTAFGIVFSLLGIVNLLPAFNSSFNALSIGGFVIVLGMLVDDAIVIAEQINQNKEEGMSGTEAAVQAVSKIWKPVFASALTTIIAFSPLTQLGGLPGKFVWIIPVIVILALTFSLFESFFILPVHLAHGKSKIIKKGKIILFFEKIYQSSLRFSLRFRYVFMLLFIGMFAGTVFIAVNFVKKEAFPQDGAEGFTIEVSLPPGSSLEKTESEVIKIENIVSKLSAVDMIGYTSRVGTQNPKIAIDRGSLKNKAVTIIYLTPFGKRTITGQQIIDKIRPDIRASLNKESTFRAELIRLGPPIGKPFEVQITANDEKKRLDKINEIKELLKSTEGVTDLSDDIVRGNEQYQLVVNEKLLAQTGLTMSEVLSTYRIALDGLVVTKTVSIFGTTDFRLKLGGPARSSIEKLKNVQIRNKRGRLINFSQFVEVREIASIGEQIHLDGDRTNMVYGNIDKNVTSAGKISALIKSKFVSTDQVQITLSGESKDNSEIFGNLLEAAAVALLGTYIVIAIILNSLSKPLIVMSVIPFSVIGVMLALYLHDMPLSMFSMMSLVGLMGIIVNGSILMIYTISHGKDGKVMEKIVQGAKTRLRPILLTTTTTFLGLMPTAYGVGGYDFFISPMCLSLGWGLFFGTFILLFFVPILFMLGEDLSKIFSKSSSQPRSKLTSVTATAFFVAAILSQMAMFSTTAEAQSFDLKNSRTQIKNHSLVHKAAESVREEKFVRRSLNGIFDSRFELSPLLQYQETEPSFESGYQGEQKQFMGQLKLDSMKLLGNGMAVSGSIAYSKLDIDLSGIESSQPNATGAGQNIPDELAKTNIKVGANLLIPLGRNRGNAQFKTRKQMQDVQIKSKEISVSIVSDQLQHLVIKTYWDAYVKKVSYISRKHSFNRSKEIHKSNLKKYKYGTIGKNELILSELNVSSKTNSVIEAERFWMQALINLAKVTQSDTFSDIKLAHNRFLVNKAALDESTYLQKNKSMQVIEQQIGLLKKKNRLTYLGARDPVDLMLGVESLGSDYEDSEAPKKLFKNDKPTYTAKLTWKFQPSHTQSTAELSSGESKILQLTSEKKNLGAQLRALQRDASFALELFEGYFRNFQITKSKRKQFLKEQELNFSQGKITTKELLEAQDLTDRSSLEEASIIAKWHAVYAGFLANTGQLDIYFQMIK